MFNGGNPNLYGYVLNDPINRIDPKGLFDIPTPLGPFTVNGKTAAAAAGGACAVGLATANPYAALAGGLAAGILAGYGQGAGPYLDSLFNGNDNNPNPGRAPQSVGPPTPVTPYTPVKQN